MKQIFLTKDLLVGEGSHRVVYKLPNDNSKCIKIDTRIKAMRNKLKNKRWYKLWRPVEWFGENRKEIKEYEKLNKRNDEKIFKHIPRFYGIVNTNLGKGIVVDYINGAKSIKSYIKNNDVDGDFLIALKEFLQMLIENRIEIRDFYLENYLVKRMNDGKLRIYLIDGLGNANLIPISEWISYVGKKKVIRRINKILLKLRSECPKYSEYFYLDKILNK